MSELQDYYNQFNTGVWADPDPKVCLCRGSGWALSDVDTFHECRFHYTGQRHPEDEPEENELARDRQIPSLYKADATPDGGKCLIFDESSQDAEDCYLLVSMGLAELKRGGNDDIGVRLTAEGVAHYNAYYKPKPKSYEQVMQTVFGDDDIPF
jgi:hypothetical protein